MLRNSGVASLFRSLHVVASSRGCSHRFLIPQTAIHQSRTYAKDIEKDGFDPTQHYEVEDAMPYVAKNVNLKKTKSLLDLFVTKLEKDEKETKKEEHFSEFEALQKSEKAKTVKAQKKKVREANDSIYDRNSAEAQKLKILQALFEQKTSVAPTQIFNEQVIEMETKERDMQTKAGDSLLSFMYESKSPYKVVESWEAEQQAREELANDFKQQKKELKKLLQKSATTADQENRKEYFQQYDSVALKKDMLEGMSAVSDFSVNADIDRMSASPTSLSGDKLILVNNARHEEKSPFWNTLTPHEKRYFLNDEYLEDVSKNIEKYLNMSQDEIEKNAPWLLNDPRWETIEELRKQTLQDLSEVSEDNISTERNKYFRERIFDDEALRNLYESLGSKQFDNVQEFYENIKEATDEQGLLKRLETMFPAVPKDKIKSILNKVILTVQPKFDKYASASQRSIQLITDEITASAKPIVYTMADIATKPKPKMQTVLWSIRQIATKKAKEKEVEMVYERAKTLKLEEFPSQIDHIYEVLRPIHDESMKVGVEEKGITEFHPAVYGGFSTATGKRKSSVANVTISPGTGLFTVNGKSVLDYFNLTRHHYKLMLPLKFTNTLNQFDVEARVRGGGQTGQCDAIFLGLSKALAKFIPEFGPTLEASGFLYRDPRVVERKKPGQKKARKKFTFVKR
ncbi:hypothetical protein C9374_005395 [Naegleria lovaniensis]|uniref:Ribosomal protein S9 n=1 Tax=Naegleria lovaniensis TaxID=51637 RepID=A0AA88GPI6_NAELO|nr:uncharacterized protein C9374_005395 [Naegleria lovaniensis]KAG2382193.1 hypothetical protein C9374_005395 [Naegleria lovaniensis]